MVFKIVSKIMDSVVGLNLLGNTNVRSVTVFLPTTGQVGSGEKNKKIVKSFKNF